MMTKSDPAATRAMRHAMVASQLRPNGVTDQRLTAAMADIPREAFLPPEAQVLAYRDRTIPIGRGRGANPPTATARLLNAADLEPSDRVLLVGAAGGYAAAILSTIVAHVTALECDHALLEMARAALSHAANVECVGGALAEGWPPNAPYDVLVVDGAVEGLPPALLSQVRPGGRVATGLVEAGVYRLATGRRTAGGFGLTAFADYECALLPGFAPPPAFRF